MALRFDRVRCKIDDLEIAADFTLTPGAIVGVTGPDPGELQLWMDLAAGTIPPDQGEVERETMFVAGATFLSGDPETVCWWTNAALACEASVLAIGPAFALAAPGFRMAALRELHAIAREGALVLLVSQDLDMLERHADEAIVIENGAVVDRGDPRATLAAYRKRIAAELRAPETDPPEDFARHGDGRASIVSFELLGADGEPTASLETGEQATLAARVQFDEAIEDPVFGILIRNRVGVSVYGTNTELEGVHFGPVEEGQEVELRFSFACDLYPRDYTVTIASHDPDGTAHDWLEEALLFQVSDTRFTEGVANLRAKVEVRR